MRVLLPRPTIFRVAPYTRVDWRRELMWNRTGRVLRKFYRPRDYADLVYRDHPLLGLGRR